MGSRARKQADTLIIHAELNKLPRRELLLLAKGAGQVARPQQRRPRREEIIPLTKRRVYYRKE